MNKRTLQRSFSLALLFAKEQLKEPAALFWIIISPAALFYLLAYSKGNTPPFEANYIESTSWFYAYISSSIAFFGFAFYIIGRRESGFIRSFIYTREAKLIFLLAQFFAYSWISLIYCLVFYGLTRLSFGTYETAEALSILARFYICYMLFGILGLLLTLLPITFQSANTIFSIASFSMLVIGIIGSHQNLPAPDTKNMLNPLWLANQIMSGGLEKHASLTLGTLMIFITSFLLTIRFLRINPVWSRY